VAEVCARLDNLPLALELAAARTPLFSPQQLLERMGERLDLFKGARDADPRQRTLRATIEWSYDLLTKDEQALFARVSVFAGGCTYEAAEQVCDADPDTLQSLLDKSLLRRRDDPSEEPRYWMLETIREYAGERLAHSGEAKKLHSRHALHFLALAEEAGPRLMGAEQAPWLERLDHEHENVRAAIGWLHETGRSDLELRLVGAVWRFWYLRGRLVEGRSRVGAALASGAGQPAALREKVLNGAGLFAHRQGDYERATAHAEERLALCRALGDPERVASSLLGLGLMASARGEPKRASAAYLESAELARRGGHREILAMVVNNLGDLALFDGDYELAGLRFEESLSLFRELGDAHGIAATLSGLGDVAFQQGRDEDADVLLNEALELSEALTDKEVMIWCFEVFAAIAASRREGERASTLLGATDVLREATGHAPQPIERRRNEQTRNILADDLGAESFAAARAIGREMTFEEAIAYVLGAGELSLRVAGDVPRL
jgi:tetratricopeptide (TPR) repeat protein